MRCTFFSPTDTYLCSQDYITTTVLTSHTPASTIHNQVCQTQVDIHLRTDLCRISPPGLPMDILELRPAKHRHTPDRLFHTIRRLATLVLQKLLPAIDRNSLGRLSHTMCRLALHKVSPSPCMFLNKVIFTFRYSVSGLILPVKVRTRLGSPDDRSSTRVPLHSDDRCQQDGKPGTTHFPTEDCI